MMIQSIMKIEIHQFKRDISISDENILSARDAVDLLWKSLIAIETDPEEICQAFVNKATDETQDLE